VRTLFGIDFYSDTMQSFVELLDNHLGKEEKKFVVTANPEIVMNAQGDSNYQSIIKSANYVVADGIGIVKAFSFMKNPIAGRIPGIELMIELLTLANEKSLSVYFLGAEENAIRKMVTQIHTTYPDICIAGFHHGFFNGSVHIVEEIKAKRPDLIFVALGAPKQETWISEHLNTFDKGIFIGVGGSFDVLSGKQKRAPKFLQRMNAEWLFRILIRQRKLKKILTLSSFMFIVMKELLHMTLLKNADIK
jgi:N-acetylglucosaminyldiphosphoundecaprenol N-acetyl-beta-D-mannosaminyltransferase